MQWGNGIKTFPISFKTQSFVIVTGPQKEVTNSGTATYTWVGQVIGFIKTLTKTEYTSQNGTGHPHYWIAIGV